VYIQKGYYNLDVNVGEQKGPQRFRESLTRDVFVPSDSYFHALFSYDNNDYLINSCWGLHLGTKFLQIGGSWTSKAPLSFALRLVASFCTLILDWLVQLLSYMLWMDICSICLSHFTPCSLHSQVINTLILS
jgi:hypothetical protein